MTKLGVYLEARSINKSLVAKKVGISGQRLNELIHNSGTHLRANELYLIALAIAEDPREMLMEICKDLKLKPVVIEKKKKKASKKNSKNNN